MHPCAAHANLILRTRLPFQQSRYHHAQEVPRQLRIISQFYWNFILGEELHAQYYITMMIIKRKDEERRGPAKTRRGGERPEAARVPCRLRVAVHLADADRTRTHSGRRHRRAPAISGLRIDRKCTAEPRSRRCASPRLHDKESTAITLFRAELFLFPYHDDGEIGFR